MPLTYFQLWMTRLMGLLPDIAHCTACGEALTAGQISFNTLGDGSFCAVHRNGNASGSRPTRGNWRSACCGRRPRPLPPKPGPGAARRTCAASRLQALERHLERKLRSAEALARLGAC
jgi:DNA repair protein RecO (recombination protein O)